VRDVSTKFGESAGKIWDILNEKDRLNKDQLIEIAQLDEQELFTAIGWLARENKIAKDEQNCFKLDDSNLRPEIGDHAGRIWKILDIWGNADIETIKRLSDLNEDQVLSALGWLAREGKIIINEDNKYLLK
jgi:hypothetical protein